MYKLKKETYRSSQISQILETEEVKMTKVSRCRWQYRDDRKKVIGRIVPGEFRLNDNNAPPCDITVHEIFIARQDGGRL